MRWFLLWKAIRQSKPLAPRKWLRFLQMLDLSWNFVCGIKAISLSWIKYSFRCRANFDNSKIRFDWRERKFESAFPPTFIPRKLGLWTRTRYAVAMRDCVTKFPYFINIFVREISLFSLQIEGRFTGKKVRIGLGINLDAFEAQTWKSISWSCSAATLRYNFGTVYLTNRVE